MSPPSRLSRALQRWCCLLAALAVTVVVLPVVASAPAAARLDTPRRLVSAWIPFWSSAGEDSALAQADLFREAMPFWFYATSTTGVFAHKTPDLAYVQALQARGVRVLGTVTDDTTGDGMLDILADPERRRAHAATIVDVVERNGLDGIDLDYERAAFAGMSFDQRQAFRSGFSALARRLADRLHTIGAELSITVTAKTSDDSTSAYYIYDYAALGRAADQLRIMAYDYHWSGSEPGAIAPLPWTEQVVRYAVSVVPPRKVALGVPLYGYDWPLYGDGTATARLHTDIVRIQQEHGGVRGWSAEDAAPYLRYRTTAGERVIWFNNARAVRAKLELAERYGLHGLSFWAVGGEDPAVWRVVRAAATEDGTQPRIAMRAPDVVRFGSRVPVPLRVWGADGTPAAGIPVRLAKRAADGTLLGTRTGTTDSEGRVVLTTRVRRPVKLVASALDIRRRAAVDVSLAVDATASVRRAEPGSTVRFSADVAPRVGRRDAKVQVWFYADERWVTVARPPVRQGHTTAKVRLNYATLYRVRVVVPSGDAYRTGRSARVLVDTR